MKKLLTSILALTLTFAVAGCGSTNAETTGTSADTTAADTSAEAADTTAAADAADENKELEVIKVGASSTPHAEILEQVKDALKEEGYDLEIVVYDDYVLPNQALADGTLDANYFQHTPYLNNFNGHCRKGQQQNYRKPALIAYSQNCQPQKRKEIDKAVFCHVSPRFFSAAALCSAQFL